MGGKNPSYNKFEGRIRVLLNEFFKCAKIQIPVLF